MIMWGETIKVRTLYKECVRYGFIADDFETKTERGDYLRETTFTINGKTYLFKLKNGEIVLCWTEN